jgi:hypothetical protein
MDHVVATITTGMIWIAIALFRRNRRLSASDHFNPTGEHSHRAPGRAK